MHQVRITNTVYETGAAKYLAGQLYPVTEETLRQVALRNGEEVDEPTEDELAAAAAAQAEAEANVTCVTFVAVNIHAGIFSLAFLCGCGWKKAQTDLRQQ